MTDDKDKKTELRGTWSSDSLKNGPAYVKPLPPSPRPFPEPAQQRKVRVRCPVCPETCPHDWDHACTCGNPHVHPTALPNPEAWHR